MVSDAAGTVPQAQSADCALVVAYLAGPERGSEPERGSGPNPALADAVTPSAVPRP